MGRKWFCLRRVKLLVQRHYGPVSISSRLYFRLTQNPLGVYSFVIASCYIITRADHWRCFGFGFVGKTDECWSSCAYRQYLLDRDLPVSVFTRLWDGFRKFPITFYALHKICTMLLYTYMKLSLNFSTPKCVFFFSDDCEFAYEQPLFTGLWHNS